MKVLYGLVGNVIAVVDVDISAQAIQDCFVEDCSSVIVAERTDELIKCWQESLVVEKSMFKDMVEYFA